MRLAARTRWGSKSAPPDPLAAIRGPTSKGREGRGREEMEGKGEGGEGRKWRGREREGKGGDLLLRGGGGGRMGMGRVERGGKGGKGKDERPPVQSKNFLRIMPVEGMLL